MTVINGKNTPKAAGKILADYLNETGYPAVGIAVEINRSILDRKKYGEYFIGEDDVIEIVSFVGGG